VIRVEEMLRSLALKTREDQMPIDKLESDIQAAVSERSRLIEAGQILYCVLQEFPACGRAAFGELNTLMVDAMNFSGTPGIFSRCVPRPSLWELPKLIPPNAGAPVVLLRSTLGPDDVVMREIRLLEKSTMTVQGVVALVGTSSCGLFRELSSRGYTVRVAIDVAPLSIPPWAEPPWAAPVGNPSSESLAASVQLPDGTAPHAIARLVAQLVLDGERLPRDPAVFDREYDCIGGTVVRIRDRFSRRLLGEASCQRNSLVSAVANAIGSSRGILASRLDKTIFEVSFLSTPIACKWSDLSRDDGFMVVSENGDRVSRPILPDEPGCANLFERYQLATSLLAPENPGTLYRFSVVRRSDDEEGRPSSCTPQSFDSRVVGEILTRVARAVLKGDAEVSSSMLDVLDTPAERVNAIATTLFSNGVLGCGTSWEGSLHARLVSATRLAASDPRFVASCPHHLDLDQITIGVTVLFDAELLGERSIREAARLIRRGLDAFSVCQGEGFAVFLESVLPERSWTGEHACAELIRKAGIQRGPFSWSRYAATSWRQGPTGLVRCCMGFADRRTEAREKGIDEDINSLASFIASQISGEGLPTYCIYPVTGQTQQRGDPGRAIHALLALAEAAQVTNRADWMRASQQGFIRCFQHIEFGQSSPHICVPGWSMSTIGGFDLLIAAPYFSDLIGAGQLSELAATLCRWVRSDGRVAPPDSKGPIDEEHDVLPGFVLNALACYVDFDKTFALGINWDAALLWYRRRFELIHPWGMLGWHPHVWTRVAFWGGENSSARFVFEMLDWALDRQLQDGSFLVGLGVTGPSFQTGYIAESVAAGWRLAQHLNDFQRVERYGASWKSACRFMKNLTISDEDVAVMKMGRLAIGGVRREESSAEVRIDYVSHTLRALIAGRTASIGTIV
jgi:hypothetical protein